MSNTKVYIGVEYYEIRKLKLFFLFSVLESFDHEIQYLDVV